MNIPSPVTLILINNPRKFETIITIVKSSPELTLTLCHFELILN